jgi:hypothetical protein
MPIEADFERNCDPLSYLITMMSECHAFLTLCFLTERMIAALPLGGYRNHCYSTKQTVLLKFMVQTKSPKFRHVFNRFSCECRLENLRFDGYIWPWLKDSLLSFMAVLSRVIELREEPWFNLLQGFVRYLVSWESSRKWKLRCWHQKSVAEERVV